MSGKNASAIPDHHIAFIVLVTKRTVRRSDINANEAPATLFNEKDHGDVYVYCTCDGLWKISFKLLLVIDMQNDFVTGSLGSAEARAIVPNMADKLAKADVPVWFTMDTHKADYMNDPEARHLPVPTA